MSKTFSIALAAQMQVATSKLTSCIRMERTDGQVYGFTMHDKALTISGLRYEPTASFNPSDIASNNNMDLENVTVTALLDSRTITEEDLRVGKWDYAAFRIFQVNWADLSMGDKKDRAGNLGQVISGRQVFIAELLGMLEAYTISIGEVTTAGCRANLGDQRCGIDLTGGSPQAWTVTGTVTDDAGDFYTIADAARTEADEFFSEGTITFTSGDANGLAYEVRSYKLSGGGAFAAGQVITKTPIGYNVLGATYTMHAGCDKLRTTCRDRFGNVANFRGEPWLRGQDAMVQVGRHS